MRILIFVLAALGGIVTQAQAQGRIPPAWPNVPDTLIREPLFSTILGQHYPQLAAPQYYFENLRPAPWPEHSLRWFHEMGDCLTDEGFKIRDYVELEEMRFYQFDVAWSLGPGSRAKQIDGAWFVKYVVVAANLNPIHAEIILRHEFIHHFIGLTYHPLKVAEVGRCMPNKMLDRLKDAEPTRPRRTLSPGFRRLQHERMGPVPFGRDGVVGPPGVFMESQRSPRGTWVLPEIRTPQHHHESGEARAMAASYQLGAAASDGFDSPGNGLYGQVHSPAVGPVARPVLRLQVPDAPEAQGGR